MNEIDLRRFDLNLLVVFDVLMTERSVTRAAERLGRTQSAVSHSLSRLREQFGDPLLIKGGARMQPTALALDLIEQARPMLGGIQRVLSPQHVFDPESSSAGVSAGRAGFHVDAVCRSVDAPARRGARVGLEWTAPREPTLLDVAEGLIDIAIVPAELRWPQGVTGEAVGALGMALFRPQGSSGVRANGAWRAWATSPHLVVRVGDSLASPVNVAASAAGLERSDRRMGAELLRSCAHPGRFRPARDPAGAGDERDAARLPARQHGSTVSHCRHCRMRWSGAADAAGIPALIWLRDRLRPIVKRNFAS